MIDATSIPVMILGELCNFAAYAFVEALVVVRILVMQTSSPSNFLTDTHGRAFGRNLCYTFIVVS